MNATQRKYAISRLEELARAAFARIKEDEEKIKEDYNKLYRIDVRDILNSDTKVITAGPHSKLSDVFDLSDQLEAIEKAQKAFIDTHEHGQYYIKLPWIKDGYRQPTMQYKDTYLRAKKLISELQSTCDTIMLGDSDEAVQAIKLFERKSF